MLPRASRSPLLVTSLSVLLAAGCGTSSNGPADSGSGADAHLVGDSGPAGSVDAGFDARTSDDAAIENLDGATTESPDAAAPDSGTTAAAHTLANVGWGMVNQHGEGSWASDLTQAETVTGRHMDIVMDYQDWSSGTAAWPTMSSQVISAIGGRPMMWTVQPSGVNWAQMIAGDYDSEIIAFADWVNSTLASTIYVRFAHEQNGTGWYNWQVGGSCGVTSAADFVERVQPRCVGPEIALAIHPDGVGREQRSDRQHRELLPVRLRHHGF